MRPPAHIGPIGVRGRCSVERAATTRRLTAARARRRVVAAVPVSALMGPAKPTARCGRSSSRGDGRRGRWKRVPVPRAGGNARAVRLSHSVHGPHGRWTREEEA